MDSVDIDNGADRVSLDLYSLRNDLSQVGLSLTGIDAIARKLQTFDREIMTEKSKGTHLGSTQLGWALEGEIRSMSPQELGLQTPMEVKLVGKLVARSTKRLTQ